MCPMFRMALNILTQYPLHPFQDLVSGEWGWATCSSSSGAPANCVGGTMPDVVSEADQAMYVLHHAVGA